MMAPEKIVSIAKDGKSVVGWHLAAADRASLLDRFAPRYDRVVADHVTLAANVASDTPLPDEVSAAVVGRADDGMGVEALVVAVDGFTDRPDGSTYHITWSLGLRRSARESNDVLRKLGWQPLEERLAIKLVPGRIR